MTAMTPQGLSLAVADRKPSPGAKAGSEPDRLHPVIGPNVSRTDAGKLRIEFKTLETVMIS